MCQGGGDHLRCTVPCSGLDVCVNGMVQVIHVANGNLLFSPQRELVI